MINKRKNWGQFITIVFFSYVVLLPTIFGTVILTNPTPGSLKENIFSIIKNPEEELTSNNIFQFLTQKFEDMIRNGDILVENFTRSTPQEIQIKVKFIHPIQNESITIIQEYTNDPTLQFVYTNCENTTTHHTDLSQEVIMGYALEFIKSTYRIEYEQWNGAQQIAYAFFGFVFRVNFQFRFPIKFRMAVPDEIGPVNNFIATITALEKANFVEGPVDIQIKVIAGIKLDGEYGEYSFITDHPLTFNYYTPISKSDPTWVIYDFDYRFLYLVSQFWPEPYRNMAEYIYQNLVNAKVHVYGKLGVWSIRATAIPYGDNVNIDGLPFKELVWYYDREYIFFSVNVIEGSKFRLDITDFQVELRDSYFALGIELDWCQLLESIPLFGDKWSFMMWNITLASSELLTYHVNPDIISISVGTRPTPLLGVALTSITPSQEVIPAEHVNYYFTIHNLGTGYDTYDLTISGIDPAWVIMPSKVSLNTGTNKIVQLTIAPPRHYTSSAGWYNFTIRATSQEHHIISDTIESSLHVLPYYDVEVLRTSQLETSGILNITIGGSGIIEFNLTNLGNTQEIYTLQISDILGEIQYSFPSSLSINPGERQTIPVTIEIPTDFSMETDYYGTMLYANSSNQPDIYAFDRAIVNITYGPTPISMMEHIQSKLNTLLLMVNSTQMGCFKCILIFKLNRSIQLLECAKVSYLQNYIPRTVVLELITQIHVEWAELCIWLGDWLDCINHTFALYLLENMQQIHDDLYVLMGMTIGGWKASALAKIMVELDHLMRNISIELTLIVSIPINLKLYCALATLERAMVYLSQDAIAEFNQSLNTVIQKIISANSTVKCLAQLHFIPEDYAIILNVQLTELSNQIFLLF